MVLKFYLAHPELNTGVIFINPFFDNNSWEKTVNKGKQDRYDADAKPIIEADLKLISKSDGVVAVVDGNFSYGTICELVYAKIFYKPLYMVVTNGNAKHPWFRYHATQIFTSFLDLEKHLKIISEKDNIEK